jgi:hypothetical protein
MTNSLDDFTDIPKEVQASIKGVGGPVSVTHQGTVKWKFQDDQGRTHAFYLPGSYYSPDLPCRLLSPQHWSQTLDDGENLEKRAWSETDKRETILYWQGGTYRRHLSLDRFTNVASLRSAPGALTFRAYSLIVENSPGHTTMHDFPTCFNANVVSDDEQSVNSASSDNTLLTEKPTDFTPKSDAEQSLSINSAPKIVTFQDYELSAEKMKELKETAEDTGLTPSQQLLRVHYKLNHLPFPSIQLMAKHGHLPKRLLDCQVPACAACMFGKATR